MTTPTAPYTAVTCNACNLCTPLGACLAFRGIEGAIPYLHGSQGCSTYIRRYLIGHFREPIDIASSNFGERAAVYGGAELFRVGLENVIQQYQPALVGVATTCLSETIGDDIGLYLHEFLAAHAGQTLPDIVTVSTPSYQGTHADGFHRTVRAIIATLAQNQLDNSRAVNLFPGMLSPADLRYLKQFVLDFGLTPLCVPDYSTTLDGGAWLDYQRLPPGGTPLAQIRETGSALGTLEFGATLPTRETAGAWLEEKFGVRCWSLPTPIGIAATDRVCEVLGQLAGAPVPAAHRDERDRLVDAYIDGHKYVSGRRAVVFGDEDLVVSLTAFLCEIGIRPVVCASGGSSRQLARQIQQLAPDAPSDLTILADSDFAAIDEAARNASPDLLIGGSKGYALARRLGVPLIRVGFPVHDRLGASRMLHVGYRGAQELFDRIVNALIEVEQDKNPVGYMNF